MPRGRWTPEGGWPAYIRRRRQSHVDNDLCYECGIYPPRKGRRRCQVCTDRHTEYREGTIADGFCRDLCGNHRADGYSRCFACLDRHARKARAKRGVPIDAPIVRRAPRRAPGPVTPITPIDRLALIRAAALRRAA